MTSKHRRFLEPRVPTPVPGEPATKTTGRLPDDMLDEQVQRFAVFSAVGAGLWALTVVIHAFVTPRTVGTVIPRLAIAIELVGVVTSVAAFL